MSVTDNSQSYRDHWIVRWVAPIGVAITLGTAAVSLVSHFTTDDVRLNQLESQAHESAAHQERAEQDVGHIREDVSKIKQQADDTNGTVHQILDTMIRRQ